MVKIFRGVFQLLILGGHFVSSAQITAPSVPKLTDFTSATPRQPPRSLPARTPAYYPTPTVTLGGTAESVQNSQQPRNTAASRQTELQTILTELRHQEQNKPKPVASSTSKSTPAFQKDYAERNTAYSDALRSLIAMLSGKRTLSVADAYFITESAYGEPYLTKAQFTDILDQSAAFIRAWMIQNRLDTMFNEVKNLAIQRFMSQPLTIQTPTGKTQTHQPYFYDYIDFTGEKDYRNTFATKCLATGGGQCAGMPVVYLMLAERLNAQAYLTVIPQHLFVKYPCSDGTIRNYEPTSNWEITDQWYADNSFISPEAIKSGLFLDTFNRKQIAATCILDLAQSYVIRVGVQMGLADIGFIKECIRLTLPYFPRNNNFQSIVLHSTVLKTELMNLLDRTGIKDVSQLNQSPRAQLVWNAYQYNEYYLTNLGYQPIPEDMYRNMMTQQEFKGRLQRAKGQNGKQVHSLFNSTAQ